MDEESALNDEKVLSSDSKGAKLVAMECVPVPFAVVFF